MALSGALLFVLGLSLPARAQERARTVSPDTLSGLVFDEVTGRPVAEASVTLTDVEDGHIVVEAASDEGGRFSVPVSPGRYWLVASRAGFAASPPREVRWDEASESVEGLLLRLRTLDREALAVRASPDPDVEGARLIGRVVDRDSGRPVFDAEVELGASGLRTLTDRNGMFVFQEVPPGTEVLRIRHLAYGEEVKGLVLEEGQAYRVEGKVSMEPIEMEGIEVTATSRPRFRQLDELRWRMERELGGEYILAEELRTRGYPPVAATLRSLPGVDVQKSRFLWRVRVARCASPANRGEPVIYVDGIKVHSPGTGKPQWIWSEIVSMDVEAIEVYKGAATVPPEYAGSDAACGAIVIWTKRGG
jgi:hypothetical protein